MLWLIVSYLIRILLLAIVANYSKPNGNLVSDEKQIFQAGFCGFRKNNKSFGTNFRSKIGPEHIFHPSGKSPVERLFFHRPTLVTQKLNSHFLEETQCSDRRLGTPVLAVFRPGKFGIVTDHLDEVDFDLEICND